MAFCLISPFICDCSCTLGWRGVGWGGVAGRQQSPKRDRKGPRPCSAHIEDIFQATLLSPLSATLLSSCRPCRMTASWACLTTTFGQKWSLSCLRATTPQPLLWFSPCTAWPATLSTRRNAERSSCRCWMAKTAWTGGRRSSGVQHVILVLPQYLGALFFSTGRISAKSHTRQCASRNPSVCTLLCRR